jgi:uncharacterized membrane protein YfcA
MGTEPLIGAALAFAQLLGISIGIGGLAGSYLGARLQPRLPEGVLRGLLGLLALVLAARYLLQATL